MNIHTKTGHILNIITGKAQFFRIFAGCIFSLHGSHKVFGFADAFLSQNTQNWLSVAGFHPEQTLALETGSAQMLGGLLLITGVFVRPAAVLLSLIMIISISLLYVPSATFVIHSGQEFSLSLLAMSLYLLLHDEEQPSFWQQQLASALSFNKASSL